MKLIPMTLIVLLLATPVLAEQNRGDRKSKKTETHQMKKEMKKDKKSQMKQRMERTPASADVTAEASLTNTHYLIYE